MEKDKLLHELAELISELGWDYDRFSMSGQETYNKLCSVVNKLVGG